VARLLVPLAIAYLWLVSLGRWVVKQGYRCRIDDGTARTWQYSLFQLGVGWKERLASYTLAIRSAPNGRIISLSDPQGHLRPLDCQRRLR